MKHLTCCAAAFTLLSIISYSNTEATGDTGPLTLNDLPSSVNTTNFTDLSDLLVNSTSSQDIPSDFRIDPLCTKPSLLPVTSLLNAVYTQSQLALGDYEGQFSQVESFVLADHPQTEMVILPYGDEGSITMPWKYAVWAVNMSAKWLIKNNKYRTCTFFISRGNVGIGAVQYKKFHVIGSEAVSVGSLNGTEPGFMQFNASEGRLPPSENITALASPNSSASTVNNSGLPHPPPPILNTAVTNNITKATYEVRLIGTELNFQRIVLTSLDVLRTMSSHSRIDRELHGTSYIASSRLFVNARDPNNPPRTEHDPPYFQAEWLIDAMTLLPGVMVHRQSFREAEIDISVDGILVGEVRISVKRPLGGGDVAIY